MKRVPYVSTSLGGIMKLQRRKIGRRPLAVPAVGVVLAAALAACGGSSSGGSDAAGSSGAKTVTVAAIQDLTGPAGLAGKQLLDGMKFGIDQFNEEQGSSGIHVNLKTSDTRSTQQVAVNLMTEVAGSDAIAVLGPALSNEGLAIAPIAQREGIPYVATQENATGIPESGDFIFRLTAPQDTYQKLTTDYLAEQGVKKVVLIYASNVASNVQWAQKTIPDLLDQHSISVSDSVKITTTDTDFGAATSAVASAHPDAVGVSTVGAQNSTVITQLRRAGYKGLIFGQAGFSGGTLKGAGKLANGAVWATDFNANTSDPVGSDFVTAWKAAHDGQAPNNFNAEGYDGALMITKALEASKAASRSAVRDAMASIASAGLDASVGHITFDNRDARIAGVLVKWQNPDEVPIG
jgi:branched-chain amino acid transport system substrate-binding protein